MINKAEVRFASPNIKAVDHFEHLQEALAHASKNLNSRYGITLVGPVVEDEKLMIRVALPEDIARTFSFGPRLRAVASYLLNTYPEIYSAYITGNKLLTYVPINEPATDHPIDGLEVISQLTVLLKRQDDVARERLQRICDILSE